MTQPDYIPQDIPDWNSDNKYNYEDNKLDYNKIDELNNALIELSSKMDNINNKINIYEKKKTKQDIIYKRHYRREFLSVEVSTESHRRITAELKCEDDEMKLAYLTNILEELKRISWQLRTQLEILETLGHNLRRELNL